MKKRMKAVVDRKFRPFMTLLAGMRMKKIWLVYFILIFLPTLLFVRQYFENASRSLKDEVADSILQAVKQVESNISYRMSKVEETSDSLMKNIEIYRRLGRAPEEDTIQTQIEDETQLSNMIQALENRDEIRKIRLFVEDRKLYASDNVNFFRLSSAMNEPWFQAAAEKLGAPVWLSTRNFRYSNASEDQQIIPLVRSIKHTGDFSRIIGALVVDMPEKHLSTVLADVHFTGGDIAVYDGSGAVVSHPDRAVIGQIMDSERWNQMHGLVEGIVKNAVGGEYLIFKTVTDTDWKVVARIPISEIGAGNTKYATVSTLVIVVSCLILFILVVLFIFVFITENTVRRVRNIGIMIKKEGIDAEIGHTGSGKGSILGLEGSVNRLIGTMRHLMKETYSANAREREAQLRALQAQINPHFLYNTLDTINWMAIRRDADEISAIVSSLAQYFRLSLSKGKDIVTVEDEINLARSYLEIQQSRFGDVFDYEIAVDEDVLPCKIPKLSLQPIIENALLHGLQTLKNRKGHLRIEGSKLEQDGGYRLTVIDNGVGMSEAKLALLLNRDVLEETQSYGLLNVRERIELFFGKTSGITIESRVGEGTRVEIRALEERER